MNETRKHRCPYCEAEREAPLSVLAHPRSIYTATCECGKKYLYQYYSQDAWKVSR